LARLPTRESGERIHIDTARIELKPLLAGFLHKRLAPRLTSGAHFCTMKNCFQLPSFPAIARLRFRMQEAQAAALVSGVPLQGDIQPPMRKTTTISA
jgi:hypothetical protein